MAVCREDMLYKDYTSNPIPTHFFRLEIILQVMPNFHLSQSLLLTCAADWQRDVTDIHLTCVVRKHCICSRDSFLKTEFPLSAIYTVLLLWQQNLIWQ